MSNSGREYKCSLMFISKPKRAIYHRHSDTRLSALTQTLVANISAVWCSYQRPNGHYITVHTCNRISDLTLTLSANISAVWCSYQIPNVHYTTGRNESEWKKAYSIHSANQQTVAITDSGNHEDAVNEDGINTAVSVPCQKDVDAVWFNTVSKWCRSK